MLAVCLVLLLAVGLWELGMGWEFAAGALFFSAVQVMALLPEFDVSIFRKLPVAAATRWVAAGWCAIAAVVIALASLLQINHHGVEGLRIPITPSQSAEGSGIPLDALNAFSMTLPELAAATLLVFGQLAGVYLLLTFRRRHAA